MKNSESFAKIFKALSNPNRFRIYSEILKNERTQVEARCGCRLTEIVRSLRIGSPTISHHLKELVNAELVVTEREGKFLICTINPKTRDLARRVFE